MRCLDLKHSKFSVNICAKKYGTVAIIFIVIENALRANFIINMVWKFMGYFHFIFHFIYYQSNSKRKKNSTIKH